VVFLYLSPGCRIQVKLIPMCIEKSDRLAVLSISWKKVGNPLESPD
jgi:hypothetical protein